MESDHPVPSRSRRGRRSGFHLGNPRSLERRVSLLQDSCSSYDAGRTAEAVDVAGHLRRLFHNGAESVSLVQVSGLQTALAMFDSGRYDVVPGMPHWALIREDQDRYLPCFDDFVSAETRLFLSFERWWSRKVASDVTGRKFSRKKLILAVSALAEGTPAEAHAATGLAEPGAPESLEQCPESGLPVFDGEDWLSIDSPIPPIIRQTGYEALVSLAASYPLAFDDDRFVMYYRELHACAEVYGGILGP
jgi:hypothetical protein